MMAADTEISKMCDVCNINPAKGECCCGIAYCGTVCQDIHLDQVDEMEQEEENQWEELNGR